MIAKPVAEKGNSKYLIWELSDINLDFISEEVLTSSNWVGYNDEKPIELKQPVSRKILTTFDLSGCTSTLNELTRNIYLSDYYDIFTNTQLDVSTKNRLINYPNTWKVEIIRDEPGHTLGIHLDNSVILSTFVINLIDNNTSTEYFYDKEGTSLIYKGPTSKGTGVFHINTPYLYHSVNNLSSKERYILLGNTR